MSNVVDFLTGNLILNLSILAWAIAQVLKFVITLISQGKLDWLIFSPAGNAKLPLCLCLRLRGGYGLYVRLGVARIHHFCRGRHCGDVRRGQCPQGGGEQAKILNYIMEHWTEMKPAIFGKELKEFLGHTPFQVLMGGLLGISVGLMGAWLWT